jgi:putative ABC transport system permease protein
MRTLWHKLARDGWRLKGQVLAIALVIAGGTGTAVMSAGTLSSLQSTREAYYERYRFGHLFATVKRAPAELARRIAEIPGVAAVNTRIQNYVLLDVVGFTEPVRGLVLSVSEPHRPELNRLALRQGRPPRDESPDEAILHEAFAEAHRLSPGDFLWANLNGKKRRLQVVGIALSPEFIHTLGPGDLVPDYRRFGVLWMGRRALEAAYDLDGAFNDLVVQVTLGTDPDSVIDELDPLLARFGGTGAYARKDQLSHAFLESEFDQLRTMTTVMPPIFLAVAAFLLNVVIARMIETERAQIGLLKAFGYTGFAIGRHYMSFALATAALGAVMGSALGIWMGRYMTDNYARYFRFPFLVYELSPAVCAVVALVALTAAGTGAWSAVRRAAALAPALAMAPRAPVAYRRSLSDILGLSRWMSPSARMVVRHIARWPVRSLLSVMGVALALGLLVNSLFFLDALDEMIEIYFFRQSHQNLTVRLAEPRQLSVAHELRRLAGVQRVELRRVVPARLTKGPRSKRVPIFGESPDATLTSYYADTGAAVPLFGEGLTLTDHLARLLDVVPGEEVTVEFLAGRRAIRQIAVSQIVTEYFGLSARLELHALNRLMGEGQVADGANLLVDPAQLPKLFRALKDVPLMFSVSLREAAHATFRDLLDQNIVVVVGFYIVLATLIVFGVVYNTGRIILSERSMELASMRVLGYAKREVAMIVVTELVLLTAIALPLGCGFGNLLARLMVHLFSTDLYRMPFVIEASSYGFGMLIVLAATAASAVVVARAVAAIDPVIALKTRE